MSLPIRRIEPGTRLPAEAGGKARGLQRIASAGLALPPSWVVMPGAPAASIRDLADALERGGHELLAVRSSAQEEDAERYSFAGIHESLLGVHPEALVDAVSHVAQSVFSDRATAYRSEIGSASPSGPCAVVVQALVASECAGIAFSAGSPGGDRAVVEAVEGLGETAVAGQVVPETLVLRRAGGVWRIEHRTPRTQGVALTVRDLRVCRVELPDGPRHGELLGEASASLVGEGVRRLELAESAPLDVEWALAGGALWFLQARPRTRPLNEPLAPGEVWTRINLREVLPDIPSAFSRSVLGPALDAAERRIARSYGLDADPAVPMMTFVHGRPVFNERILLHGDLLGVPREIMQAEFGGSAEGSGNLPAIDLRVALRHPSVLARAIVIGATSALLAGRFVERLRRTRCRLAALTPGAMSEGAILKAVREAYAWLPCSVGVHATRIATAASSAQYQALARSSRHPHARALLNRLIGGGEASISTRMADHLVALAKVMRAWPGGRSFLEPATAEHASPRYWREKLPASVWSEVAAWLERYGHRGPFESDIAAPRYSDDLRLLGRALLPLVCGDARAVSLHGAEERSREAARAEEEIERDAGRRGRRRFGRGVQRLKRLLILRERLRSEAIGVLAPLRGLVLELGWRLERRGQIASHDDVWNLSLSEIDRALTGAGTPAGISVARERARLSAWRRIEVPNRFTSEDVPAFASPGAACREARAAYSGNAISPGVVEARVQIIRSPLEHERFSTGGVLVAPATDPGWTPLFARAVGIIVEVGGALSHAGIVAREYGLPCVANIPDITRLLQQGDLVRLDGTSGQVTVLDRSSRPVEDHAGQGETHAG